MFLDGLRALAVSESGRDEVFVTISRDANWDYEFCCGDDGRYRLGAPA
ncbi:hypothetical protein GCM10009678_54870 [Actinomadura kijaniata]